MRHGETGPFVKYAALFLLLTGSALAQDTLSLHALLEAAKERNPDIKAARQSWKVVQAEISPANTWPNPTFTYVDEKFPSGMAGVDPAPVKHYRFEQMVPFPGKISGESRMKHHEALVAESTYRAKMNDVLSDVRIRYYQLYRTDQKISLAKQTVEALRSILQTAQSRLASGQSTTSDIFMAQMELRKMENMLFQEQQERTLAEIEINTLLDQPTDTKLGAAQPPELIDLPVSLGELQSLAKENNPQYQATKHETNHARAMISRNRLEYAPDFEFMYERESAPEGDAGRQIGVGITFPLWLSRPWGLAKSANESRAWPDVIEGTKDLAMRSGSSGSITFTGRSETRRSPTSAAGSIRSRRGNSSTTSHCPTAPNRRLPMCALRRRPTTAARSCSASGCSRSAARRSAAARAAVR
jgi:hypothetical protein